MAMRTLGRTPHDSRKVLEVTLSDLLRDVPIDLFDVVDLCMELLQLLSLFNCLQVLLMSFLRINCLAFMSDSSRMASLLCYAVCAFSFQES